MPRPIVIYTALRMEGDALARTLPDVPVTVIGLRAMRLPDRPPTDCICILAGLAGGLDPALKIGDVVIDADEACCGHTTGRIHTAASPILTPEEKAELFRSTGAQAVDMEGRILRQFLAPSGVPLVHIRAISDVAGDAIDPAVLGFVDDTGRPRPAAVAAALARRPSLIPHLMRLRANARVALVNLVEATNRLVPMLRDENRP